MATIKAVKKKTSSYGGLKKSIDYIENPEKTEQGKLIIGYNCTTENAFEEFRVIKELRENEKGVMSHHFTQNFDPNDNITPEKALELGKELAEKNFKGHQVIIATHVDKEHIHNHLIVNSVNYETGKKLINNNKLLEQLKSYSDKQCERENLHIVDRAKKSKEFAYGIYDKNKYEVIVKALEGKRKCYLVDLEKVVKEKIKISKSREEFIKNIESEGYKIKWNDKLKHITYEDKEGHKVRADNLAKTFSNDDFKKEEMLKQFEKNKQELSQPKEKDINTLRDKKAMLQEQYKKIDRDFDKIKIKKDYESQIKKYEKLIENEKEKKKGYNIFKRSERKNSDSIIGRYENAVKEMKSELMGALQGYNASDEEIARIENERAMLKNQIAQYENEIRLKEQQEREIKEKLEQEKQLKELDEDKKQRIPSEFREKDIQEDKPKINTDEIINTYVQLKMLENENPKLKTNKEYQEKLKKAKELALKYSKANNKVKVKDKNNKSFDIER